MSMRAVIRANRLLSEMGFTNTIEALEELNRLRSVTPELLEALNDLLNDVGRASSLPGARKARAAIARAEGKN